MKKNRTKILFFIATLVLVSACTAGFEEINTRQDRPTKVDPELLFGLTPVKTLRELSSNNNWYFFGNYTNQLSVIGGGGPHFTRDGRSERIFSNLYTGVLNPITQIVKDYGDNPGYGNRVAIAKIWRSYVFSQLVALYGPCPYTEACNGEPYIPYDSEPVIYRGILAELEEAYKQLEDHPKGDTYPEGAEPFLKSELARWAQFAHCIRLRVAMRLCDLPTTTPAALTGDLQSEARAIVAQELKIADDQPAKFITSNTGNFFMKFSLSPEENQNPIYREVRNASESDKTSGAGNLPVAHESIVMWMLPYHDPCWDKMFIEGDGEQVGKTKLPTTKGRPHSFESPYDFGSLAINNPYSNFQNYDNWVHMANVISAVDASFYFYTYPELVLTKAEAALLGYYNGKKTAEQLYYEGIDARGARWGASTGDVSEYKEFAGIKWSTPSDTVTNKKNGVNRDEFRDWQFLIDSYLGGPEDNYKRIVVQHWLSLFVQGWDSYTLLRRTGVLKFKPHFGSNSTEGYLNALNGYTWAYTPQRLCYPRTEWTINKQETANAIGTLLFDNKLRDLEDWPTFRLLYTKNPPEIMNTTVYGTNGREITYSLPNLARNY